MGGGGDERLNNMEQVVLKLQNVPEQLHLLANSLPVMGLPSIVKRIAQASETVLLLGSILEPIQGNDSHKGITIAECTEQEGRIPYRGKWYVRQCDQLQLR